MSSTKVSVQTRDGDCPASVFRPAGGGSWPAGIMYMDGIGIRPALAAMAERLATAGYVVLLPDLFYRAGPYEAPDPKVLFSDLPFRQAWSAKYISTATIANVVSDTAAFLDFLAGQTDVRQPKVG